MNEQDVLSSALRLIATTRRREFHVVDGRRAESRSLSLLRRISATRLPQVGNAAFLTREARLRAVRTPGLSTWPEPITRLIQDSSLRAVFQRGTGLLRDPELSLSLSPTILSRAGTSSTRSRSAGRDLASGAERTRRASCRDKRIAGRR